jgi:hypothetical protein
MGSGVHGQASWDIGLKNARRLASVYSATCAVPKKPAYRRFRSLILRESGWRGGQRR